MGSKELISKEKYRPLLHLTASKGWLNDPNGLIRYQGRFHQFYQYHPHSTVWGPMHWGHQSSVNLLDWEEHDIALYPDENGMCFSGSAVFDVANTSGLFPDSGGLVAVYTSFKEEEFSCADGNTELRPEQHQSLAHSKDSFCWKKLNYGKPILMSGGNPDFRDPKVFWHEKSDAWIMVLACGQHIEISRSANLKDWVKVSEFGHRYGFHSKGPWECPDLFPLTCSVTGNIYWVLIVGIGEGVWTGGSGTQYFIGNFDGFEFTCIEQQDKVSWLDYGRDHYATQSFSNMPESKRIISAWMNNHQYAKFTPTEQFRGALIVPRKLALKTEENGRIVLEQYFIEWLSSRATHTLPITSGEEQQSKIERSFDSSCTLLELQLSLREDEVFEFSLFSEQEISFVFSRTKQGTSIRTIREDCGFSDLIENNFSHNYSIELEDMNTIFIQLLVDSGLTTLLINNRYAFTNQCFPRRNNLNFMCQTNKESIIVNGTVSLFK